MSHPLWRINRERFKYITLQKKSTLEDLCKTRESDVKLDVRCIFLELDSVDFEKNKGGSELDDAILIDKV